MDFIVEKFPTLQEYINVSYIKMHQDDDDRESRDAELRGIQNGKEVVINDEEISASEHPLEDIYMPE